MVFGQTQTCGRRTGQKTRRGALGSSRVHTAIHYAGSIRLSRTIAAKSIAIRRRLLGLSWLSCVNTEGEGKLLLGFPWLSGANTKGGVSIRLDFHYFRDLRFRKFFLPKVDFPLIFNRFWTFLGSIFATRWLHRVLYISRCLR